MAESFAATNTINNALYRLGEKPILTPQDSSAKAAAAQALYASNRNVLLSWQAWPFATVRQALVRLTATPPSDFAYYYAEPTLPRVLRLLDIDLTRRHLEYQREVYVNPLDPQEQHNVVATNADGVVLRYIGLTSEATWSPLFVSTLEVMLAASLAPVITGKASLANALTAQLYGSAREPGLLTKLRDISGHEDSPQQLPIPATYAEVRGLTTSSAPTRVGEPW